MMKEFPVRPFEQSDWPDMVRFYEQFYRPGYIFTQREFFDWNFSSPLRLDARSGQRLVLDGERIIGIMGSLPWPLQVAGHERLGNYNINLFLDPEYRGARLGQRLLTSVSSGYSHSLTNGYNAPTLSMYERLGRVHHWPIPRFVKCIDPDGTQKLLAESPRFASMSSEQRALVSSRLLDSAASKLQRPAASIQAVERFGPAWDEAWNEIRGDYGFTTWRSSAFLNWRYSDYPFPLYRCFIACRDDRPCGLCVLRVEEPPCGVVVRIIDLVGSPEARRSLLGFAQDFASERGALFVDYVVAGRVGASLLQEAGYHEFDSPDGEMLLPMDFAPLRFRDRVLALVTFLDEGDPGNEEFASGQFYVVKGDGDLDRAN